MTSKRTDPYDAIQSFDLSVRTEAIVGHHPVCPTGQDVSVKIYGKILNKIATNG